MIKPILCGPQQSYLFNKKESHGLLRSVQKSVDRSLGSNQSSQTKEKKSLKCVTNKHTKPIVSSQFKKQAQLLDTNQKVKNQAKNQKINHLSDPEKQKAKVPINSYFLLNQNRRKFQSLSNRPLLNASQNKNTRSQHSYFLNKTLVLYSKPVQKHEIKQKPDHILSVKKQQQDSKQKKFNQEKSQIFKTQKQKNSRVSFLSKPNFPLDQNNKYSLKPHFSVGNFKSSSHQNLKNSKSIESLNNSQQRRPFLRSTLKFEENTKNSGFYNIKTQRQNRPQIEEKSNLFPLKKADLTSQQRKQRISTEESEKVLYKQNQLRNENNVSMSRFFSLKTSRFFIPKRHYNQKPSNQQQDQKDFGFTNLDLQIINQDSRINLKNDESKKYDLSNQGRYNIQQQQMQLEEESNLTDSTKVSTFFNLDHWKKRQNQNKFTSENDSFMQSRFGFHTQSNPKKYQNQTNFMNYKLKSRVGWNQLETSKQKFSNDQKIQRNVSNSKRNTINHQPFNQNFTLTKNFSMQGSLIYNNIKKQNNQDNLKEENLKKKQNQTNKFNRNSNKKPSFFADLQRKKQQHKEFKRELEKVILQRDEQQNLESDQLGMFSNIEIKDAESVVDSEFNNSQKDSELQFVLHSTDKIQLKSFAHLNTLQSDRKNFFKFK